MSFLDYVNNQVEQQKPIKPVAVCSFCGSTIDFYKKNGKMGCPHCYQTLKNDILPIIKRIHKSDIHIGAVPLRLASNMPYKIKKLRLERELDLAEEKNNLREVERLKLALERMGR